VAKDNLRTVFVVNPAGAGGRLGKIWPKAADIIRSEFGDFEVAETAGPLDAVRLAREAIAGGAQMVVAVGGDGTINEVANGFFPEDGAASIDPEVVFGLLPFGTGGDFRKTFSLDRDVATNARRLRGPESRPLDVGRVLSVGPDGAELKRWFVNIASFGMSGEVVAMVNESSKALGGKVTFLWCTVRGLVGYKNPTVRLIHDGGEPEEATINTVAVCNGRFFGGGMHIGPMAKPDDGRLERVTIGDASLFDLVRYNSKLYAGKLTGVPLVTHETVERLRAEPVGAGIVKVEVEGESAGQLPADFEIHPGAIRIHT